MKKVLLLVFAFVFLFSLMGCDPSFYYFEENYLLENTVKIELYDYQNDSPRIIKRSEEEPVFDFSKATLIATADETRFEKILTELNSMAYGRYATSANAPVGKTLVLHQKDGTMIVLFGCRAKNEKGRNTFWGNCLLFDENCIFLDYFGETYGNFAADMSVYFE